MKPYIALFRGINVGGRSKLPMRELVDILENLGLHNIHTYIQSGNVVFQNEDENIAGLAEQISTAIDEHHGFSPNVIILTLEEFENAASENPYPEAEAEPKTLHVYFLAAMPEKPDLETLERLRKENERYTLLGKAFYLHAPDGIGRSKLAARAEKALGVAATARNWRSVGKILELSRTPGAKE